MTVKCFGYLYLSDLLLLLLLPLLLQLLLGEALPAAHGADGERGQLVLVQVLEREPRAARARHDDGR